MQIPTHEKLLADIEAYLFRKKMKPSDFGQQFLKDSGAVCRLKNGQDPRLSKVLKIYKVITGK